MNNKLFTTVADYNLFTFLTKDIITKKELWLVYLTNKNAKKLPLFFLVMFEISLFRCGKIPFHLLHINSLFVVNKVFIFPKQFQMF